MIVTSRFGGGWRRSVALVLLAMFGLPAIGYSADTSTMVAEGRQAYDAKDYARARELFEEACNRPWIPVR